MRENLTARVLTAIAEAPCSVRSLAKAAGVSVSLLYQLQQRAFNATPAIARKLATALETWGADCTRAAQDLRAAARRVPTPRTRGKP